MKLRSTVHGPALFIYDSPAWQQILLWFDCHLTLIALVNSGLDVKAQCHSSYPRNQLFSAIILHLNSIMESLHNYTKLAVLSSRNIRQKPQVIEN